MDKRHEHHKKVMNIKKVHHKRGKPMANKHMIMIELREMQSKIHDGITPHAHQND